MSVARPAVRALARVAGVVQGVGFRPFVYNLACELGLSGWVTNTAAGVELAVQGADSSVAEFFRRLETEPPPLAAIESVDRTDEPVQAGEGGFAILPSRGGARRTLISPDAAVCEACLAEMRDPDDRRHRYPFINCTHCGPRFTIIRDLPYDRPQTTMDAFTMCPACQAEYDDPADRRFHAQPNACPVCGPRLWLADERGRELEVADPLAAAAEALGRGDILAVKGLGGFHLAVNAADEAAVARLRERKRREEKPLAVMVADLAGAAELAEVDAAASLALSGRERPIVLLAKHADADLASGVAPGNRRVGVMLPYTPLHHLLLDVGRARRLYSALVMTSGNLSDEPICLDNAEAVARLGAEAPGGAVADLFLLHDRDIHLRADDSVLRVVGDVVRQMRRSRGYAPAPLVLPRGLVPEGASPILAVGAHLKSTLCLLRGREAFLSQHVGDLDDARTLEYFEQTADHLTRILEAEPQVLACDLHPDYLSTQWAAGRGLPLVKVQHHHAHAVAVMAEHGLGGRVLALSLDGTGYGPDNTVWGGELLAATAADYTRLGRLRRFPLPGGDAAVKEPWRTGLALIMEAFGPEEAARLDLPLAREYGKHLPLFAKMAARGLNTPATSSLGRLFDGAAAIAGLRYRVAYEGQAAVELEQAMDVPGESEGEGYPFPVVEEDGLLVLDWAPAVRALADDVAAGAPGAEMSSRFHAGLLAGLTDWALTAARSQVLDRAVLGGGCFLNEALLVGLPRRLASGGLAVYTPALVPAGDGGLALGQAVCAAATWGGQDNTEPA